jgi:hypothetical protein
LIPNTAKKKKEKGKKKSGSEIYIIYGETEPFEEYLKTEFRKSHRK